MQESDLSLAAEKDKAPAAERIMGSAPAVVKRHHGATPANNPPNQVGRKGTPNRPPEDPKFLEGSLVPGERTK